MYNSHKQKRKNWHDRTSGRIKKTSGTSQVIRFYNFDKRRIEKGLENSHTASMDTKQSPYPKRTPGIDERRTDPLLDFRIEKQKQQAR